MEWIELGKLAEINNGYAFKSKNYKDEGIRIIRITNVQKGYIEDSDPKFYSEKDMEGLEKFYLFEGDILISLTGNVGRVARVTKEILPAALNQRVGSIKPNEKINNDYLFHIMNSNKFESICINESNGVAQKNLGTKALDKIKIPVPPIEIQKQIVEVLDEAQKLIDNRKKQIKLLDDLIESIFYDMFGDPVRNDKGFKKGTIRDLTEYTQYGTSKKASDTGEFPILRMGNITYEGNWDFSDLKYIDLDDKEKEKYLVRKGDLLFNRTNSKELVGKTAVYREIRLMAYAGYLIKLETNSKGNTEYISAYLNSKCGKLILLNMAKNIVGMANINAQELQDIKIPIPPIQLQNQFADKVQAIEKQKELLEESLRLLEDNYNSLMQRAFKGELF